MFIEKGCFYLPSNKREGIIFAIFMCTGMVLIMTVYNTMLHGFASFTFGRAIIQFAITFVVAFAVESVVEPRARKLALSFPYDKSKQLNIIIAISLCMVPTMVIIMSGYGLILMALTTGIEGSIFIAYLKTVGLNIIVALPAQLLLVGPIARSLLTKYIKPSTSKQMQKVNA